MIQVRQGCGPISPEKVVLSFHTVLEQLWQRYTLDNNHASRRIGIAPTFIGTISPN